MNNNSTEKPYIYTAYITLDELKKHFKKMHTTKDDLKANKRDNKAKHGCYKNDIILPIDCILDKKDKGEETLLNKKDKSLMVIIDVESGEASVSKEDFDKILDMAPPTIYPSLTPFSQPTHSQSANTQRINKLLPFATRKSYQKNTQSRNTQSENTRGGIFTSFTNSSFTDKKDWSRNADGKADMRDRLERENLQKLHRLSQSEMRRAQRRAQHIAKYSRCSNGLRPPFLERNGGEDREQKLRDNINKARV